MLFAVHTVTATSFGEQPRVVSVALAVSTVVVAARGVRLLRGSTAA